MVNEAPAVAQICRLGHLFAKPATRLRRSRGHRPPRGSTVKVLYVSSVPSKHEFARIAERRRPGVQHVTYGMSESGFKFHTLIMEGLVSAGDCDVFSLVGRSVSRSTYAGGYWRPVTERDRKITTHHVGFLNIPVVKQVQVAIAIFLHTTAWLWRTRGERPRFILMDASYITVLPGVLLASSFTSARSAAIFADIYGYMGAVQDARDHQPVAHRVIRRFVARVYKRLHAFVLLTEQMDSVVNPGGKPHLVMEGLVDVTMREAVNGLEGKSPLPTVLYAGALRRQYGLENLVRGFQALERTDARLEIYGDGDYAPEIRKAALQDPRISYGGTLPNDEIVAREMRAWLLINPRPARQEFTQYSFPSKNMEYMVSGTPVLTTPLPGMPADYYNFVSIIDGDSSDAVSKALARELGRGLPDLHAQGHAAREFVLTRKNNIIQAARIITALEKS